MSLGKSNVVDVLSFVHDAMHMGLSGRDNGSGRYRCGAAFECKASVNVSITLDVELGSGPGSYAFEITGDRREEFSSQVGDGGGRHGTRGDQGRAGFTVERGKWNGPRGLDLRSSDTSLALSAVARDERFGRLFDLISRLAIYSIYQDTLRRPQTYSSDKPMHRHATTGSRFCAIRNRRRRRSSSYR